MKKFTILLFFLPAIIFAQGYDRSGPRPNLSVSGLVIDSVSNEPLSFAALSFISTQDDQLITGGICNNEGRFIIEEVPVGVYKLLVEYMGYVPKIILEVKVRPNKNVNNTGGSYSATNSVIDLGEFYMNKSIDQLEEIELIEEKPFVVQGIDRKGFKVDQDLTSSGSTAIELMEKLPSVELFYLDNDNVVKTISSNSLFEKHLFSSNGLLKDFITEDRFELSSSIVEPLAHFF